MADEEEIRWLRSTANELNNLLQLIGESQGWLAASVPKTPETQKFLQILQSSIVRAREVGQTLAARASGGLRTVDPVVAVPAAAEIPGPAIPHVSAQLGTAPSPSPTAAPIPVLASEPVTPAAPATPTPAAPVRTEPELILIVDDEEFILLLAQEVLSEAGYRVITAKDGFQALEIFKKYHPQISLVVLDFMMPVMDGEDVFAEMQMLNPKVPVVLSSGFTEQDRLRSMLARGLRGFIPKPYTQEKLLNQIRQTLDALK